MPVEPAITKGPVGSYLSLWRFWARCLMLSIRGLGKVPTGHALLSQAAAAGLSGVCHVGISSDMAPVNSTVSRGRTLLPSQAGCDTLAAVLSVRVWASYAGGLGVPECARPIDDRGGTHPIHLVPLVSSLLTRYPTDA